MTAGAPCLMVQGTASDVGKSVLVTALCRLFARAGYRVAPFKAQNMSLNAAVTSVGGEISRAQAAQAQAAGVEPTVDMNPVLLKPEAHGVTQVVVRGRAVARVAWHEYRRMMPELFGVVTESLARLRAAHDVVLIEGAGNPAEPNFYDDDIVNMAVARTAEAPVLLVGDIDRGGVFAAFLGTLALLTPVDRARVAGLVVNKFRGNAALLEPSLTDITRRTGVPVVGVVPYLENLAVPAEDSLALSAFRHERAPDDALVVGVVAFPRMANFDDFEPLAAEPGVYVQLVDRDAPVARCDALILPGSKSTIADLAWMRTRGLASDVAALAAHGRPLLGICGGYQMLGTVIQDPHGVESTVPIVPGLGLLPVTTVFATDKRTVRVHARVNGDGGPFATVRGHEFEAYEIHAGVTDSTSVHAPFEILEPQRHLDGARSGAVLGTYLHGLFDDSAVRRAFLRYVAAAAGRPIRDAWGTNSPRVRLWDRLADAVATALNLTAVERLVGMKLG